MKMPCPACKKSVKVGATKCPYCQTEYSAEQIAEMKSGVKGGLIFIAVIFAAIFLLIWACSGDEETSPSDEAKDNENSAVTLNNEQERAVTFVRAIQLQALSCSGDVEFAQAEVNKAADGRSDAVEAYRVLGQAEKSCASAADDIQQSDVAILANVDASKVAIEALKVCGSAADTRERAMALGRQILEGNSGIKVAADFRDRLIEAKSSDQLCKLQLRATVEPFQVPDRAIEFLD